MQVIEGLGIMYFLCYFLIVYFLSKLYIQISLFEYDFVLFTKTDVVVVN